MGTYAVPENDKGWSYAFSASARLGGNDWIQGVYYRSFAYYAGVEKNWGDVHRLALVSFAAPGQRGAQNASTQEVYDLMGDNMYNSNWGYQNGKVRNARNRITFEPITFLKYDYTPSSSSRLRRPCCGGPERTATPPSTGMTPRIRVRTTTATFPATSTWRTRTTTV